MSENFDAVAVDWLHAAQAPVRPRHYALRMQALLQQLLDQLILSNTLPRPAARALFSLHLHRVSFAFRLCAPAPVVGDGGVARVSGVYAAGIGQGFLVMMFEPPAPYDVDTTFLRYHLLGVLGWLYPVGCPEW